MNSGIPSSSKAHLGSRERFLKAARQEEVDRPPFWFMRQAGRYLPEYHKLRKRGSFMDAIRNPEIAAELTLQPVQRFDMDAAIVFSDILVPVAALGVPVDFVEGRGPVLGSRLESRRQVEALEAFDPEEKAGFLKETMARVRHELGDSKALLGFCGAPFTTASYLIEGGSSRSFERTKALLHGDPDLMGELLERLVDALVPYLGMQVAAGADALQIFDSWGGALDARSWREVLRAPTERLICTAKALGVPVIFYVNGCAHLLSLLPDLGPDVLSIDWRADPARAREVVGGRCALQGNLDPAALFAPPPAVAAETRRVLQAFGPAPGHIFNLGSGFLPTTPLASVEAMVAVLKETGVA